MDNISLFFLIFGLSNHSQTVNTLMIFGARFAIYLTFLLMFFLAFRGGSKERKALLLALLSLPIVVLIIKGIHIFFFEPRPFVTYQISSLIPYNTVASFPSGHASIASAIAFSYTYFKSKWAALFLFLLLWTGFARIYVGVHYPLDIVGGILVGIASVIIAKQISKLLRARFFLCQSFKS